MSIKIACLSDTHGFLDERMAGFLKECDEIWHAGDIGDMRTAGQLSLIRPLTAVHGNIDDYEVRQMFPEHQRFERGGIDIWITHIGGYPGKYAGNVRNELFESPPGLFICGHSHILKVMHDKKLGLLHINPGAAGRSGMHRVQTAVRFVIEDAKVGRLEILELERRYPPNPYAGSGS